MNIKRKLFGIWGLGVFVLALFVFLPWLIFHITFRNEPKYQRKWLLFFNRFFAKLAVKVAGVKVEKSVCNKIDTNETYIIVSNHRSMFDMPVNVISSPVLFKFLGKKEVEKMPIIGFVSKKIAVLVQRDSHESRSNSILRLKQELKNGFSIFIYPEGTRNKTSNGVLPFKDGAFRLAIEMQKPLLVNTIIGTEKITHPNKIFDLWCGTAYSYWHTPISTIGMKLDNIETLKNMVKQIMIENLEKHDIH